MKKESLEQTIGEATTSLLNMARELTWNTISDNCAYIITQIKDSIDGRMLNERLKIRKKINSRKTPETLSQTVSTLQQMYSDLYDINLYVYKSSADLTIIEVQYYPKSVLDVEYRKTVQYNDPMLHCKVAIPPYAAGNKERFDINWQHQTWEYRWKMFWLKRKMNKQ